MAKSPDPKDLTPAARRLVDAAEDLIGVHGVANVSNVQIAKAAGHRNKYAVQYHFGALESLIEAIFDDRLSRINARRGQMLDALADRPEAKVRDYVAALILPMHEEVGTDGRHRYTRFIGRIMDTPLALSVWQESVHSSSALATRQAIRDRCPQYSDDVFALRYELALEIIIGTFRTMDRGLEAETLRKGLSHDEVQAELLDIAMNLVTRLFT